MEEDIESWLEYMRGETNYKYGKGRMAKGERMRCVKDVCSQV